jgi:hypothetical protein
MLKQHIVTLSKPLNELKQHTVRTTTTTTATTSTTT